MLRLNIREHMEIIGSCGNKLGSVDHVKGRVIKLAKTDSVDGDEHFIPLAWVERIDQCVHLNKKCHEVIPQQMRASAVAPKVTNSENANHLWVEPAGPIVQPLQPSNPEEMALAKQSGDNDTERPTEVAL
jgi:hypothetical protein